MNQARRHVQAIAAEPRPSGSKSAEVVREYITGQLRQMGFDVSVHESVGACDLGPTPYGPRYRGAGRVRSIVATLAGYKPGKAVLMMTHYDSVGQGPGAGDAGMTVAAVLEAARSVVSDGIPRNDLLVVITDGEEAGTLGAQTFFEDHPLASTVGVVLNFDARGTSGPVLMFETGPRNTGLIQRLARAGVPVYASSLFADVYKHLPSATDFTHAKNRGLSGLNFANVRGFVDYHGPNDDLAHLSESTLRHHVSLATGMLRQLSAADLDTLDTSGDDVFFTVGAGRLVRYPMRWVTPLTIASTAVAVWAGAARPGVDTLAALGRLGLSAGVTTGLVNAIGRVRPEFFRSGDFHDARLFYLSVCSGVAAAALLGASSAPDRRARGASTLLAAGGVASAAKLPGASYLTTWPLLGSVVARRFPTLGVLPAAALLGPLTRLLFDGLTPRMSGSAAAAAQLLADLAAPSVSALPPSFRRKAGWLAAATAVGSAAVVALRRPSAARPAPDTLSYLLDADSGQARWVSSDRSTSDWTVRVLGRRPRRAPLGDQFAGWKRKFLQATAPVLDLPPPEVAVLSDESRAGRRVLRLRVASPRGARQLRLTTFDTPVLAWSVDGRSAESEVDNWELWLHAVPPEGFVVRLEVPHGPLPLGLADRADGLPEALASTVGPRSAHSCAAASLDVETWANATLVTRTVRL